jgi:hypothetical protein
MQLSDNIFYVESPSVAPGLTIDDYRRSRPRRSRRLARVRTYVRALG